MAITMDQHLTYDLVEIYTNYKRNTSEIISWLRAASRNTQASQTDHRGRSRALCVDELRYHADRVLENSVFVPDTILSAFRTTIEARETMSNYYRSITYGNDRKSDESHAFFTVALRKIYHDLKGTKKRTSPRRRDSATACHVDCSNPFECLLLPAGTKDSHNKHEPEVVEIETVEHITSRTTPKASVIVPPSSPTTVENDRLELFMNLHAYIIQINDLSTIVTKLYERAAADDHTLTVAAITTNVVYQCSEHLARDLHQQSIFDHTELLHQYGLLFDDSVSGNPGNTHNRCQHDVKGENMSVMSSLEQVWSRLIAFKTHINAMKSAEPLTRAECQACKVPFQDPLRCFGVRNNGGDTNQDYVAACLDSMLHSLHNNIERVHKTQPSIRFRTPLLRDLDGFLRADDDDLTLALQLTFGLHLLLESYQAFLGVAVARATSDKLDTAGKSSKTPNPRIQSLKFATDLKVHLEEMMHDPCAPCECLKVNGIQVAQQIKNYHFMLQDYLKTPRFDLLAQSPWISGQHMLDHLMLSLKYGFQGWHHGYFVGLILHVYNALVQVGVLTPNELPVLEAMCNHFDDTVFMGSRSSPNTYSCYKRWTGGRVAFSNHRTQSTSAGHSQAQGKKWNMCSVPDASHGGDHKHRGFVTSRMSLFSLLAEGCNFLDGRVVPWIEPQSVKVMTRSTQTQVHQHRITPSNLITHVSLIRDVLTTELSGNSPARINTFHFYRLCLEALRKISDLSHPDEQGLMCRCMPERCLRTCEMYRQEVLLSRAGKIVLLQDRAASNVCRDVLREVFGALTVEDVLWNVG